MVAARASVRTIVTVGGSRGEDIDRRGRLGGAVIFPASSTTWISKDPLLLCGRLVLNEMLAWGSAVMGTEAPTCAPVENHPHFAVECARDVGQRHGEICPGAPGVRILRRRRRAAGLTLVAATKFRVVPVGVVVPTTGRVTSAVTGVRSAVLITPAPIVDLQLKGIRAARGECSSDWHISAQSRRARPQFNGISA